MNIRERIMLSLSPSSIALETRTREAIENNLIKN